MNLGPPAPSPQSRVFLSHSSSQAVFARILCDELEASGIPCWYAPRDIPPGPDWPGRIQHALASAHACVLLLSKEANESPEVRKEIDLAAFERVRLIGVRIDDAWPTGSLAYQLSGLHWIEGDTSKPATIARSLTRAIHNLDTGLVPPSRGRRKGHMAARIAFMTIASIAMGLLVLAPHAARPLLPKNWHWLSIMASSIGATVAFVTGYLRQQSRPRMRLLTAATYLVLALLLVAAGRTLFAGSVRTETLIADDICTLAGDNADAPTVSAQSLERLDRSDGCIYVWPTTDFELEHFQASVFVPPTLLRSPATQDFIDTYRTSGGPGNDPVRVAIDKDASKFIEDYLDKYDSGARIALAFAYMVLHMLALAFFGSGFGFLLAALEGRVNPPLGQMLRVKPTPGTASTRENSKAVS